MYKYTIEQSSINIERNIKPNFYNFVTSFKTMKQIIILRSTLTNAVNSLFLF
jgi:hypothetical protein